MLKWQLEKFRVELQSTDMGGGVAELVLLDKDLAKVTFVDNATVLEDKIKDD